MTRNYEYKTLHFDLSYGILSEEYTLKVGHNKFTLKRHSEETLARHRKLNQALKFVPDKSVTHYIENVKLPADSAQLLFITSPAKEKDQKLDTLWMVSIHVPREARKKVLKQRLAQNHYTVQQPHPKLAMHCNKNTMFDEIETIIDVHDWKTAMDTAVSIVFHHGELLNIGAETAAKVTHIIEYSNGISDLAYNIYEQAMEHKTDPTKDNWVVVKPFYNPDGTPIKDKHRYVWTERTKEWMVGPLKDSLIRCKNDLGLLSTDKTAGCFTIQHGTTSVKSKHEKVIENFEKGSDDVYWTLNNLTPHHGFENFGGVKMDGDYFVTAFKNNWLRWLSVYVEFLGSDYKTVIKPLDWKSPMAPNLIRTYDSDTKKYVQIISSVNTIMAIPVGGSPTEVKFKWPSNASGVRILAGGIGRSGGIKGQAGVYHGGWDSQVCTPGAIMTGIFNFAIPLICLGAGALINLSSLNHIASSIYTIVLDVARVLVTGPLASIMLDGNTEILLAAFADSIFPLLLDITELIIWIDDEIEEGAAQAATPIIGWIATATSIVTDVALLAETTVEVTSSPSKFELIATKAMNVEWTLLPDKNHQDMWPREATHFEVIATYKDGTSFNTRGKMTSPQTGPLTVRLEKIPAGGEIKFTANFFSESNWLCGNTSTDFMSAEPTSNKTMVVPQMNIKEKLIPLTVNTKYLFNNTLKYNAEKKEYEWSNEFGESTATIKNLDASNIGHNLANPLNVTLSQNTRQLAYTWQASGQDIPLIGEKEKFSGQMWAFQSIDTGSNPQSGLKIVENGFQTQPLIVYDLYGSADGNGCSYYIDPRKKEYHLRPIILGKKSGVFDLKTGRSFGRFNEQIDACVIHPSGYAVGISNKNSKIEILNINILNIYDDKDAPMAEIYSGYGSLPGKIHKPIGIACLPDAGVLVLENKDSYLWAEARIQAFDLLGNPVKTFANYTSSIIELKEEKRPVTYLDIDVESKGFIYVLKYLGDGAKVSDYLLDIYYPDGSCLTQTQGISASKIAVDIWRTLFTLNFEIIEKPDDGRTEPSISIWLPSTP